MSGPAPVVLVERAADHLVRLTLNRPEARNAVNGAVSEAVADAVRATEADDGVRVVILTGASDQAFSAGADLKEIAAGRGAAIAPEPFGFGGLVKSPRRKPWITAVNGFALGGGLELALACDMVVAAEHAEFGLPEVQRGLAAFAGGVLRLTRRIPRAVALEMIATGAPITAARAQAVGLVNAVAPAGGLQAAALALARRIASNAPVAVRESLVVARRAIDSDESELWKANTDLRQTLAATEDAKEGPRAFVEKRAPRWIGR